MCSPFYLFVRSIFFSLFTVIIFCLSRVIKRLFFDFVAPAQQLFHFAFPLIRYIKCLGQGTLIKEIVTPVQRLTSNFFLLNGRTAILKGTTQDYRTAHN